MSRPGFSPLQQRMLPKLLSLIRDREPDRILWAVTEVPLKTLYESCYRLDPEQSYELQRRNQRQAMRRALGRLYTDDYVNALALAWVNVSDEIAFRWQGGGSGGGDMGTPRWRMVGLTRSGIAAAEWLAGDAGDG